MLKHGQMYPGTIGHSMEASGPMFELGETLVVVIIYLGILIYTLTRIHFETTNRVLVKPQLF